MRGMVLMVACSGLTFVLAAQESDAPKSKTGLERLTAADTPLKKGDRISFFGDSVTMQGGYIQDLEKALKASEHTNSLEVQLFIHGLNGGRVPTVLAGKSPWGDLGSSMESLLEKDKPTIILIYLGINDVWHGDKGTSKDDFKAGLKTMLALTKKTSTLR